MYEILKKLLMCCFGLIWYNVAVVILKSKIDYLSMKIYGLVPGMKTYGLVHVHESIKIKLSNKRYDLIKFWAFLNSQIYPYVFYNSALNVEILG